jgi:hypothetical protein
MPSSRASNAPGTSPPRLTAIMHDHDNQRELKVLKRAEGDGEGFIVIDDLVDTGGTLRHRLPHVSALSARAGYHGRSWRCIRYQHDECPVNVRKAMAKALLLSTIWWIPAGPLWRSAKCIPKRTFAHIPRLFNPGILRNINHVIINQRTACRFGENGDKMITSAS